MTLRVIKCLLILFSPLFFTGCFLADALIWDVDLNGQNVKIAVVDTSYSYQINASLSNADDDDLDYYMIDGDLPDGLDLDADGEISGTPTEVGLFEFEVLAYYYSALDLLDYTSCAFDANTYDDPDDCVYENADSAELQLFATEASSNPLCPSPDDETTTGLYLCLGERTEQNIPIDNTITLDLNYFINIAEAQTELVNSISLTISFDAESFTPIADYLDEDSLREAATQANATVTYDTTVSGQLTIILTSDSEDDYLFDKPGRLMDLYFTSLKDLDQPTYNFTIVVNTITSTDETVTLPTVSLLNGLLTVTDNTSDETETTELTVE